MSKTKIAIFDLTGCEGCEFHLLSLNELLIDFFQEFEIVNWRLLKEKKEADFDIAFVEGAVTTKEQIKLLKEIRQTSKIVVALGACAITGNVFAQIKKEDRKDLAEKIYEPDYHLRAEFLEPVEKFIKVEKKIPGCPPSVESVKKVLKELSQKQITSPIKEVAPPDYTAKIEGHGVLKINFKQKTAEFEVVESERLVEGLLLGKHYSQAPYITSRICGICPIAHNVCSFTAIEKALTITLSKEAEILRKILLCAQMIKSHLLHLFFLVLPDFAGLSGAVDLAKKYPAEFHLMLNIKRVADKILEKVGGSSAFPVNTAFGGFRKVPSREDLLGLQNDIFEVLDEAQDLIKLFAGFKVPDFQVKTIYKTILPDSDDYPLYGGTIDFMVKEIVQKDSPVKLGVLKNNEVFKVGALARINAFGGFLNKMAKEIFEKLNFNPFNPYHNNLAQAVEILHFLEEVVRLIDVLQKYDLSRALPAKKIVIEREENFGEATLEAPRGILIHQVKIDNEGKILNYNIIPPTQLNLASLQKEAKEFVVRFPHLNPQQAKKEIEKLIRAFDPCITCAVH